MTQPRVAEFIWLKQIVDRWIAWEEVDGDDIQEDFYDGGSLING